MLFRSNPIWDVATLERRYPGYPKLQFEQYVEMMHEQGVANLLKGNRLQTPLGPLTLRFIKFYSSDPGRLIESLTDEQIESPHLRDRLAPVRFLHSENLVSELREFLAGVGFPPARTSFMRDLPRLNAAEARRGRPWSDYYTPE